MGVWEFVLIYLGVFLLLQFVAYRYFRKQKNSTRANWTSMPNAESGPVDDSARMNYPTAQQSARSDLGDTDGLDLDAEHTPRCPTCGVGNEPDASFTFCWNCTSPLRG